jgi:glycosyltransferase involved in cell wall biosynthesis
MPRPPAISCLMPVRDGERFLAEAVESVLTQSFSDLELVVVDDGSTDSTPRLLDEFASRDSRVVVVGKEPGRNLAEALNLGARNCRAPIIARLDADDVAMPERFQQQVRFLAENPEVSLLGGQALLVDEDGREFGRAAYPLSDSELRTALDTMNPFVHSAIAMRRDSFEQVGGYRVNFDHAEDVDLWLRIAEGHQLANLPDVVVKYRIHGNQLSLGKQEVQPLFAVAARASARARSAGGPDPFEDVLRIDEAFLKSHGATGEEITAAVVDAAAWLGRTTDRAGYPADAGRLFDLAYARARSDSGSPALVASVHRSLARRHQERGNRFRANMKAAQAKIVDEASSAMATKPIVRRLIQTVMHRSAQALGWRVVVPLLRARSRRRLGSLEPGAATIVTVNWNSWPYLEVLIDVVKRRSPPGTRIIAVDNGSQDESPKRLADRDDVRTVALPMNMGHELAMDIGVLLCETEFVVALDVDAFPLNERWLQELLGPLSDGAMVSGARLNREYVHPCCWAMRTARFVEQGHSFRSRYQPRSEGRDASGDVGEEISTREAPNVHFLEVTSQRGPGDVGTVFGGLVYHNFYATRFNTTSEQTLDGVVAPGDPGQAWEDALRRYVR